MCIISELVSEFFGIEEMCRLYRKAMGRGRKGVLNQSYKKVIKRGMSILEKDNQPIKDGVRNTCKPKVVVMQEDVLNELRQIDPRELANILVGM